jgi:hypothetical protein
VTHSPAAEQRVEKTVRKPAILLAVTAYFGVLLLALAALGISWYRAGLAPDQPIAFPHTIHVSKLNLPCNFCHIFVDRSRHAGPPPLEKCMSCHTAIATEREEIRKLARHYEEKRPVEWNRVYSLPEHVYFSHKRHVKAQVDCSECHGKVGAMKKVRKVGSLKMGWCVSCHRVRGASLDCATCHK